MESQSLNCIDGGNLHELMEHFKSMEYLGQGIQEWTKWNFWKTAFKKFEVIFFKGCLPQILFGAFLNTLTHLLLFGLLQYREHLYFW